jgi:hypothetical protein
MTIAGNSTAARRQATTINYARSRQTLLAVIHNPSLSFEHLHQSLLSECLDESQWHLTTGWCNSLFLCTLLLLYLNSVGCLLPFFVQT